MSRKDYRKGGFRETWVRFAVKASNIANINRLKPLVEVLEQTRCDFTRFSAAPEPVI
jgi:hypothetical protein